MNCPNCNAPLDPNQRFCGSCGQPVIRPVKKDNLDINRTIAADPYEYESAAPEQNNSGFSPEQNVQEPYQPEQNVQEPYQPEQNYQEPYQPEQNYQEPYQPEQNYQEPYQPEQSYSEQYQPEQSYSEQYQPEQSYSEQYQPEQSYSEQYQPQQNYSENQPSYSTGGNDRYAEQYRSYQQPSQYGSMGNNAYGYSTSGGVMVNSNKKKMTIIIIIVAAVVLIGGTLGIVLGAVSCANKKHRLVSNSGTFIVKDKAIDVNDSSAEGKIEAFLTNHNISKHSSTSEGEMTMEVHGNTILTMVKAPASTTEEELREAKKNMMESKADMKSEREIIGVNNLVEVVALMRSNGSVYYVKVQS